VNESLAGRFDMRSSHARHPATHHHTLLLAAAAVAVTAVLIRRQSSSSNRRWGSDGKEDTENNENLKNEDVASSADRKSDSTRFPWEPAVMTNVNESGDTSDDDDDIGAESEHVSTGNPNHHQQQQDDQLEFLASMTFASSSLRQPSCPCCV